MLLHIFAITINRNALSEVPCTQLTFMSKCTLASKFDFAYKVLILFLVCDALGTCASSLILVLRTRAVWHRDLKVTIVMGVLFLGQIATWSQSTSSPSMARRAEPLTCFLH